MKRISVVALAVLLAAGPAAAACDPHYRSKVCVPVALDVDCAGGMGDGPAYVQGPFEYEGEDIYGLDRDGNGIACELPRS